MQNNMDLTQTQLYLIKTDKKHAKRIIISRLKERNLVLIKHTFDIYA